MRKLLDAVNFKALCIIKMIFIIKNQQIKLFRKEDSTGDSLFCLS